MIRHTKSIFARHGIPELVISDNGPQYASDAYEQFSKEYQFQHETSSPYFPQSNGEAERAVKIVKDMLKRNSDPYLAMLAYRTTPIQGGQYIPAELLMNRVLRTTLPTTRTQRAPQVQDQKKVKARDEKQKLKQKQNFDNHHGARPLSNVNQGTTVWIPAREMEGIVNQEVAPRSLLVSTEDGAELRRNRRHIIELPQTQVEEQDTQTANDQNCEPQSHPPAVPRRSHRIPAPRQHFAPYINH